MTKKEKELKRITEKEKRLAQMRETAQECVIGAKTKLKWW